MGKELLKSPILSADTETNSLHVHAADFELVGLCLAGDTKRGFYIPVGHKLPKKGSLFAVEPTQLKMDYVLRGVQYLLNKKDTVMHNAKFDINVLRKYGVSTPRLTFDTLIAASLLRTRKGSVGLKFLTKEILGEDQLTLESITGGDKGGICYIDTKIACDYGAQDALYTLRLYEYLKAAINKPDVSKIKSLFYDVELPLVNIVASMEWEGISIDKNILYDLQIKAEKEARALSLELYSMLGRVVKLRSDTHMLNVIYKIIGYKVLKGIHGDPEYSTGADVLKRLFKKKPANWSRKKGQEFITKYLRYRGVTKTLTTYTYKLAAKATPDNKIHTSWNQVFTTTGRFSSSGGVNLQNLQKDITYDIRTAFISGYGNKFVLADYKALEMKIAAAISGDKNMIEIVSNPIMDIHKYTAHVAYKIPYDPKKGIDKITDEQRFNAKTVGFGIMYGRGAPALAQALGITNKEAQKLIDSFFLAYPGVKRLFDNTTRFLMDNGYVETFYGRRRYFFDGPIPGVVKLASLFKVSIKQARAQRKAWIREANNLVTQGTGADIVKKAMLRVDAKLIDYPGARVLLQIHDEIGVISPSKIVKDVGKMMEKEMTTSINNVILDVDIEYKNNLSKAKTI